MRLNAYNIIGMTIECGNSDFKCRCYKYKNKMLAGNVIPLQVFFV